MARGDQLSRQWKIIQALSTSRRGKPASQLAGELDCHARTIYRDLEALQAAGFPIFTQRKQGKTFWSILDAGKHQPPLPLNLTELMALHFSRKMLKVLQGTVIYDALISLFDKVKATLPQPYLDYLEKAEQSLGMGLRARNPQGDFQTILPRVHQAVQEQRVIEMDYFTMSRRALTRRRVSPYRVWFYDESFYIVGRCHRRRETRVFALDRIVDIMLLEDTFEIPQDIDIQAFMDQSFGVFQGEPIKVKIHFGSKAAGYIREKIWHPTQQLVDQADGSLIFTAQVAGVEEIKFWVLKWGKAARVLEPEPLRLAVLNEARAMMEQYRKVADHEPN
jgi:predicted DNA-binding transcriptional regulator YafY